MGEQSNKFPIYASILFFLTFGCNSQDTSSVSSASTALDTTGDTTETVTAAVSGAVMSTLTDTIASQTLEPQKKDWIARFSNQFKLLPSAFAFPVCPTTITGGSQCSVSGQILTLNFGDDGCKYHFGNSGGIWVGGTQITTVGTPPSCGSFPTLSANLTSITRTFTGNLLDDPTARTNPPGTVTWVIDTSAPSSSSFANANSSHPTSGTGGYAFDINTGGGFNRKYIDDNTQEVSVAVRIVSYRGSTHKNKRVVYDHTLSTSSAQGVQTPLTVTTSGSGTDKKFTTQGKITLQHNLARYTVTSTLNDVVYSPGCCYPVGGSITSEFSGGPNDGKSETISFSQDTCNLTSLGLVEFKDAFGTTVKKNLTECL